MGLRKDLEWVFALATNGIHRVPLGPAEKLRLEKTRLALQRELRALGRLRKDQE